MSVSSPSARRRARRFGRAAAQRSRHRQRPAVSLAGPTARAGSPEETTGKGSCLNREIGEPGHARCIAFAIRMLFARHSDDFSPAAISPREFLMRSFTLVARRSVFAISLLHLVSPTQSAAAPPLPLADPSEVGMSAEKLALVMPAVEEIVGSGRIAGRSWGSPGEGKLVLLEAAGASDLAAGRRWRRTRSCGSIR